MNRKIQISASIVLTVLVGAVFYYSFMAPRGPRVATPALSQELEEEVLFRHPLTGLPLEKQEDFFVISVMFDNFSEVTFRPGLEHARVVYEALAEGGITRLMALFDSTQEIKNFGPIRSIRPYFVDWASEYGGAVMHVGGSPDALRKLASSDLVDIDQIGADEQYFNRDETYDAPHNVFSSFSSWLKFAERLAVEPSRVTPWKFEKPTLDASVPERQQVTIVFAPGNQVAWAYNKMNNTYVRFLNGERQLLATGDQMSASNLVLIEVESETIDSIGRQKMKTLGQGDAAIYTNGIRKEARWIKETAASRMRLLSESQEEIVLTPGVTWIEVVPSLELATYETFTSES